MRTKLLKATAFAIHKIVRMQAMSLFCAPNRTRINYIFIFQKIPPFSVTNTCTHFILIRARTNL